MNHTQSISNQACFSCKLSNCIETLLKMPARLNAWLECHSKDLSPIFLRLLLAYEFGEAGLEKLHGENWFANVTFPFPVNLLPTDLSWTLATGLEIIGPFALILGLMTRFFSVALMILTIVAIATVHWPSDWHTLSELWQGYAITNKGYGNFKLPLMYLLMLASLTFSGAGRLSLDHCLSKGHRS